MRAFLGLLASLFARFTALVVILGGTFVLGSLLVATRSHEASVEAEPLPVAVTTARQTESFVVRRKFAGRITPGQVSDLGFPLGGRIVEMPVDEGTRVEKDAVLARLDTDQLVNRRAELRGQAQEIEANLKRAAATYGRTERLVETNAASRQALDDIAAERDGLRARRAQTRAALDAVETDLEDSVLRAPFAGEIVRRTVDVGAVVSAGEPVFRLNESGVLEARVGVPPTFRRRVEVGDRYTLSAGDLETTGVVSAVVADVNAATRTLMVVLEIEDDPGFVARDLVRLTLAEEVRETGIWTPAAALNESVRGLWSVYVAEPEGSGDIARIVRKDVELIHAEEDAVYVRGTLEDGDLVVRSSPFRFAPGQRVRIVERAAPLDVAGLGLAR